MYRLPWCLVCCLALFSPSILPAQAVPGRAAPSHAPIWSAALRNAAVAGPAGIQPAGTGLAGSGAAGSSAASKRAESFLLPRVVAGGESPAVLRMRGMRQGMAVPHLLSANQPWQPVGPTQVVTGQFGDVTGRITSLAIAPWDASGNTVYFGSTGGGVWRSTNAASSDVAAITWQPLTDDLAAYAGVNLTSLSVGALSVQPGGAPNGVVLAGTGDPNDALDSYYGAGILRSPDGGTTWTLITESQDGWNGGLMNYSFGGEAFSGFAWSTATANLVVAAVTVSYDSFVNNINNNGTSNMAEAGMYYSPDAGQTWFLSTIEDGPNQVIQSSQTTIASSFPGVPASAVVWNPVRQMFYAAIQYHGYYQSPDGMTWIRMTNQPGTALTRANCPSNTGFMGDASCTIFRGALAVNPNTGDMFALSVDVNDIDQGLWEDVCNAGANGCANPTVLFGTRIPDGALEDGNVAGAIPLGTYNLTLAAVPNSGDTLLFAGTPDIFRCSLAAGCVWRNTTNAESCASAQVAPSEHAVAFLGPPAGQTLPLLYFGNDGGLWRSADGVDQPGAVCAASDATHYQNLNGGLGSLAEVTGLADSPSDSNVLLAGFGVNGSAATANAALSPWTQLLSEDGGYTAIDPSNPNNWYATLGPGVSIGQCTQGSGCTTADFGTQPGIGVTETGGDEALLYAPFTLDSADSANMIVGTCRVWRGPVAGGSTWGAGNAISPMFDGRTEPYCNGDALVRSLGAGGPNLQPGTGSGNSGAQVIYAGMAGLLDGGGGSVSGHVFVTQAANLANGTTQWTDVGLSPVANESSYNGVFNPYRFDVSALYVDPHDATGNTVYATVQGFGAPHLYFSTNGGTGWINVSKNLPDLPLNDVVVDPNDASMVYVASDGGVFVTQNIANCEGSTGQCWNVLGTGLPMAPAVKLATTLAGGGLLRVGTYGRGIWQIPLLSGTPQTTMTLTPSSLTFGGQPLQTSSSPQTVTVTNTGSAPLGTGSLAMTGDFAETDNCGTPVAPGGACQIQVTFAPSASGTRTGTLTVPANVAGGQQTVSLTGTGTTQSAVVVMPNAVSFGGLPINTTSAAQQVTISNTSSSGIALNSETVTGPFAIQINSCSGTLAGNTGCTVAIVFTPTQAGAATGVLTVTSGQGTETIALNGTGENPATDTLAPASLAFPATFENSASAPQTITLTNSGGAPLTGIMVQATGDFQVVDGCNYSLNGQSACTLTVEYTPHAAGAESGSVTVTDILRSQTILLTGTGIAPPTDTLSATSLIFGATVIGHSSAPQMVTVTNSGGVPLTGLSIRVSTGFTESSNCAGTLAAQASCAITVSFQATTTGAATGQLDVVDVLRTQVIALSGFGETAAVDNLTPMSLNFAPQGVGTVSPAQTVTLSNNGQAALTGIRLQSGNPDFQFTTTCGVSLQTQNSCAIQVAFAPHAPGPDSGTLAVVDANRTQLVQLNGAGALTNVTLTPGNLNFGAVGVQISSAVQALLLSNGSTSSMSGISFAVTGPYTQSNTCGTSLPAGGTCMVSVVFLPTVTGPLNGTVTMSSASTGPMTVDLVGSGLAYELLPTSATSVSVKSGSAASYSLELAPVSGSSGSVTLTCSSAPPNSSCTLNPQTASLSAPSTILVAVATGVAGPVGGARRVRGAGMAGPPPSGLGSLLWGLGILGALLPLVRVRRRTLSAWNYRVVTLVLMLACLAGVTACGKGGGPLGTGAPNPLPAGSLTPPGTYVVTVTATAGGMEKSVGLTVQVQ